VKKNSLNNILGVKKIVFGGVLILAVVFTYFKTHDLLFGNGITIDSPTSGETLRKPFVIIRGSAPGSTILTIGGAKVVPDQNGRFHKETILGVGYNVIDVVSVDRFNREAKERLELVYKPQDKRSEGGVALISY